MAGVRKQLDLFGAIVLAVVVGIAGGTIRDLLIGIPPATFRDWRYLAVAASPGSLRRSRIPRSTASSARSMHSTPPGSRCSA
jgi:uncharacterized membrane protein YeiH